jgi:hypothetical protein
VRKSRFNPNDCKKAHLDEDFTAPLAPGDRPIAKTKDGRSGTSLATVSIGKTGRMKTRHF